jgi:hypothetical protein
VIKPTCLRDVAALARACAVPKKAAGARPAADLPPLALLDRYDLLALIFDHDVVVFVERIVAVGLEWLFISLDQPFVFADLVKPSRILSPSVPPPAVMASAVNCIASYALA